MDAVVLSVTSFAETGMSSITVLNSVVLAIIANSITKFAIVAFLGNKTIALHVGMYFVISLAFFIGTYSMVVL